MYIYSEKTKKTYDTVEECINAEKAYDAQMVEEEERKAKLAKERKVRAKEIEDSYKHLMDLVNQFVADYGSYHFSINSIKPLSWFNWPW